MTRKLCVTFSCLTLLLYSEIYGQGKIKSIETTYLGINGGNLGYYRSGKIFNDDYIEYNFDGTISKIYATESIDKKITYQLNEIHSYENRKLRKIERIGTETKLKYNEENYFYDDNLNLIKVTNIHFENDKPISDKSNYYLQYLYDKNETIEKQYEFNEEKKVFILSSVVRYIYDDRKNIVKEITEKPDGRISTIVNIIYNTENQKIEQNSHSFNVKYIYNKLGEIEEEKIIYNTRDLKETINYSYQYDNNGNWIEQKTVIKRDPSDEFEGGYLIKRKIEYF